MLKSKPIRVHVRFDRELLDIIKKRVDKKLEPNPRSLKGTSPRLTLAFVRHPLFKKIKEDVIKADLKEERNLK